MEMEWKRIEEVKEFKYLGYTMRSNGSQKAQVKEKIRKSSVARTSMGDRQEEVWRRLEKKNGCSIS